MKFLIFLLFSTEVYCQSMGFTMNGMLSNAPYWVDSANNEVSSVQFTFENAIAGNPNTNVDSDTVTIRIISEDEAGANLDIIVTRPSDCTIGGVSVSNNHIFIIKDGSAITSNSIVSFIEGASTNLIMRFSNSGSYGDDSGPVNCSSGNLTYTY